MIFWIGFSITAFIIIIVLIKAKKPLQILTEVKWEILYSVVGFKAMLEDFIMKQINKTNFPSRSGKVAVITGGTRGIGLEVVRILLKCDITVVIGCRNTEQGKALLKVFEDQGIDELKINIFKLDVSSMDSVQNFAAAIKQKYAVIHYLINNAGIMFGPYTETKDGYESQFATNYLGHFLLTHLLLSHLKLGGDENCMARIVNVSSCAYVLGKINFDDINNKEAYISGKAYAQSKLAQILFTKCVDNFLRKEGVYVQVHSVHPGIVNTDLFNGTLLKKLAPWITLLFKHPKEGAIPIVYSCLSQELEGKGGTYISNCKVFSTNTATYSIDLQERLFNTSNKLLNIEHFGTL